eukprot:TRINITY_DN18117_c0_g1_i2.p4 TRINITY_DN18117_c0_g1~~TRINITY_DN18117_c0_g1_i2.p4  ORF type:complete len:122 (-),score=12.54 TRINITY_DN18117_c0_g1_i2:28-393(-)
MEINYHLTRIVYEHLLIGKYGGGNVPVNQSFGVSTPNRGMNFQSPGIAATPVSTPYGGGSIEDEIVQFIKSNNNREGTFVNAVHGHFSNRYPQHQILRAIENLKLNGRVFTGSSEDYLLAN